MTDLRWQADAACQGQPDAMFLVSYTHTRRSVGHPYCAPTCGLCKALGFCGRCPVIRQCLTYALNIEGVSANNRDGVWGGKTPARRQAIHDEQRSTAVVTLLDRVAAS